MLVNFNLWVLTTVSCGAGIVGITMAKEVKQVKGIDISTVAISNAKQNAAYNGIRYYWNSVLTSTVGLLRNTVWIANKAETIRDTLLNVSTRDRVVAVL